MDGLDFFLLRYEQIHRQIPAELLDGLPEGQVRGRAHPGVNTIAWLVWHMARIEDVGANRFVVVDALRGQDLATIVPAERVRRVAFDEGAVADKATWLADFWAGDRTRAWILAQTPLLHVGGHYYEARVARGLWGHRSP